MSPPARDYLAQQMSEQEYLDTEPYSDVKREYIDGYVYAMSGAKASHNRITSNVSGNFWNHLKGGKCQSYTSEMRVKVGKNYFYPDVLVDCTNLPDNSIFTESPVIIVEVLSRSTRRMDETTKRVAYMQLETLQEYVLIEQDFVKVDVLRRSAHWFPEHYYLGDLITLESIGLTLPVEDLYDRVQNEDMVEWIAKKEREAAEAEQMAESSASKE